VGEYVEDSATDNSKWNCPESDVENHAGLSATLLETSRANPNRQGDSNQNEECIEVNPDWAYFK
jgi:hypothetical protein